MIVDGIDLFEDLGLRVVNRGESLQAPGVKLAVGQSPFAFKRVLIGRQATDALKVTLRGSIATDDGLTPAAAKAQLQDRLDRLKWRLRQQTPHTLSWTDITDRFWDVEFDDIKVRGTDPDWIQLAKFVDIRTLAVDPRAKSETQTVLGGTGSPFGSAPLVESIIPIGDAPQAGIVRIEGNTATPLATGWTLEYRDESDAVLKSLTWDGQALASGEIVRIALETGVVELDTGSGFANAIDDLRAGSDIPIQVDPNDGADDAFLDQIAAKVPDLRLDGAGDVDEFTVTYRARFW